MKRLLRIVALILAVAAICLSFTGCEALDRAREEHGIWVNNKREIDLNGTRYIKIPYCEYLNPISIYYEDNYIYVTDPDVPVLLKSFFGKYFDISSDKVFIYDYNYYYCRSDRYEDIARQINEGVKLDNYCYYFDFYDKEIGEFIPKYYKLTDEQKVAVDKVVKNEEPIELPDYIYDSYSYFVSLDKCSDDMFFKTSSFDINVIEQDYYIEEFINDGSDSIIYRVPDDMKPIFEEIMKTYVESEEYWNDYYSDDWYY